MIYINNLLSYVGLRAPQSLREAQFNLKNNLIKVALFSIAGITGGYGIIANLECNRCILCIPPSHNPENSSSDEIPRCIPSLIASLTMSLGLCVILGHTKLFSLFKTSSNRQQLCALTKSFTLASIITFNGALHIGCIVDLTINTHTKHGKLCSFTGLSSATIGSICVAYSLQKLLFSLCSNTLETGPTNVSLEMISLSSSTEDNPRITSQALFSTHIINLLESAEINLRRLLDMTTEEPTHNENPKIYDILTNLKSIFDDTIGDVSREPDIFDDSLLGKMHTLPFLLAHMTYPFRQPQNIELVHILLAQTHTLIRLLINQQQMDMSSAIQSLTVPLQSFCPTPHYEESELFLINTPETSSSPLGLPPPYYSPSPSISSEELAFLNLIQETTV